MHVSIGDDGALKEWQHKMNGVAKTNPGCDITRDLAQRANYDVYNHWTINDVGLCPLLLYVSYVAVGDFEMKVEFLWNDPRAQDVTLAPVAGPCLLVFGNNGSEDHVDGWKDLLFLTNGNCSEPRHTPLLTALQNPGLFSDNAKKEGVLCAQLLKLNVALRVNLLPTCFVWRKSKILFPRQFQRRQEEHFA